MLEIFHFFLELEFHVFEFWTNTEREEEQTISPWTQQLTVYQDRTENEITQ